MIDERKLLDQDDLRIHETKGGGSYGIKLLEDGKVIACAYIKPVKLRYHLYRVFVEEENRGKGLGKKIMNIVIENFGERDIDLCAYPNRISDYEERKEYYRQKLFEFYEKWGFKRQGTTCNMIRESEITKHLDVEDLFE